MTDLHILAASSQPKPLLRPMRRDGTRVVAFVDQAGMTVAAELPVEDYKQMSTSAKSTVAGRPYIETWCNVRGRVDVPVTLLDLMDQPIRPTFGEPAEVLAA